MPGAGRVRHLGRRPNRHLVAQPLRNHRAWLYRHALHGVGHVPALDNDICRCERGVGVTLDDRRVAEQVARAPELLDALVGLPVGMDERCLAFERGREVGHDRERLVVDLDQRRRLLGNLGRRRGDARDDVALEPDRVLREEPAILDHAAVEHVRHVFVGDDGEHAGERPRLRRVDARDLGVGVVGVAELGDELAREHEIGRVEAGPRHFLLAVRADEHPAVLDRGHCHLSSVRV